MPRLFRRDCSFHIKSVGWQTFWEEIVLEMYEMLGQLEPTMAIKQRLAHN